MPIRRIDLLMAGFYVGLGMSLGATVFMGVLELWILCSL